MEPETFFIKPFIGLTIIDPERRDILPPEGRAVRWSAYWERLLRCGEVILINEALATSSGTSDEAPAPKGK